MDWNEIGDSLGDMTADLVDEEPTKKTVRPPRVPLEALRPPRMPSDQRELYEPRDATVPQSPGQFGDQLNIVRRLRAIEERIATHEKRFWALCALLVLADKVDLPTLLKMLVP